MGIGIYLSHHGPWIAIRVLGHMLFCVGVAFLLFGFLFAAKPVRSVLETGRFKCWAACAIIRTGGTE